MPPLHNHILALDVGDKRVGVAVANVVARLPRPLTTLENNETFFDKLRAIIQDEDIGLVVVGLPRGLDGQHTDQTRRVEAFMGELKKQVTVPLAVQDEALTTVMAETRAQKQGRIDTRAEIDARAAAIILEDYLLEHQEHKGHGEDN